MDWIPCKEARKGSKRSELNWIALGIGFAMPWQSLLLSEICDFSHRAAEKRWYISDAAVRRAPWVLVPLFLLTQPLPALPGMIRSASWERAQAITSEMTCVGDGAVAVLRLRILVHCEVAGWVMLLCLRRLCFADRVKCGKRMKRLA